MWLIKKWYSQTIDIETDFLYTLLEEKSYMKIPELMIESTEEKYTYRYILTLIKSIYSLVQASNFRIKEYINTMTLK